MNTFDICRIPQVVIYWVLTVRKKMKHQVWMKHRIDTYQNENIKKHVRSKEKDPTSLKEAMLSKDKEFLKRAVMEGMESFEWSTSIQKSCLQMDI